MFAGVERDFQLACKVGGVRGGLGFLNARTRFRMTVLCSLADGVDDVLTVYDREDPRSGIVPSLTSLSVAARAFAASCAPAWAEAGSAGAVVAHPDGRAWGVLFHYDLRLRIATPTECSILQHLGNHISRIWPASLTVSQQLQRPQLQSPA